MLPGECRQDIREYTNIPVAEIILTGQEIALMVAAAKSLYLKKKHLQIALIGFESMFSDTSYFDELFGITLKTYFMKSMEQAAEKVELAIAEGADVLLGGDTVNSLASQRNFPSCFINSTEESIRSALAMAEHMALSAETEKTYAAQFETVLDNANNGIFEIDEKRKITIINRTVEELLKKSAEKVKGEALESFFPELDIKYVNDVLEGRRDMFTTSTYLAGIPMMITVAPVQYEEKICGAIISCIGIYQLKEQYGRAAFSLFERICGESTVFRYENYRKRDGILCGAFQNVCSF